MRDRFLTQRIFFFAMVAIPAFLIISGAITHSASLFSGLYIEGLHFSLQDILGRPNRFDRVGAEVG